MSKMQHVENAWVLAGGKMTHREMSYVQLSRASKNTRLYTSSTEAGKELTALSRLGEALRTNKSSSTIARLADKAAAAGSKEADRVEASPLCRQMNRSKTKSLTF